MLEARDASGGTWDLFRYPGIRSDSDMFTLGYRLRPWRERPGAGRRAVDPGLHAHRAREYDVDRRIRYRHRVVAAGWDSDTARGRSRSTATASRPR